MSSHWKHTACVDCGKPLVRHKSNTEPRCQDCGRAHFFTMPIDPIPATVLRLRDTAKHCKTRLSPIAGEKTP